MRTQFEHLPQKSGRPSVVVGVQTIHGAGQHQSQRVFARTVRARQNDRLGKAVARQHLAQAMDDVGVAVKIVNKAISFQLSAVSQRNWQLAI